MVANTEYDFEFIAYTEYPFAYSGGVCYHQGFVQVQADPISV